MCSIGVGFSYGLSNESMDCYSINDDEIISLDNDEVYFDSNASYDGDGSQNNPYRYLNSSSLSNCSIAHLSSGEYNYNSDVLNISSDLFFVGESPDNTFIRNIKVNNSREGNTLSFVNVTLINPIIESSGILKIENCIFRNGDGKNSNIVSKKSGNAIFNPQINIIMADFYYLSSPYGIFDIENTVVTIFNSNFYNNVAYYGGVIHSFNSNLTLNNSSFYNNHAYYGGVIHSFNSNLTLNNSSFYNNSAVISGGVLYDSGWSNVNIINSNFDLNHVDGYGGVITGEKSSKINIDDSTFSNNNASYKEGGVIYINESLVDINKSLFVNSFASFGGVICNLKSETNIKNTTFNSNVAIYSGGAIYNMYSTLNITQTLFDNNNPSGLFLDNSTVYIQFSNFTQTDIELYYVNKFNKDNYSIFGDIFNYTLSLNRISGAPIYCGNYGGVNVTNIGSYDGRVYNLNTSVKNQENGGNCWAFAALATLESCILKTNNQSIFNLSEENMKNVMARFSDYGLNKNTNGGGDHSLAMGYLSSWFGPVLESEDIYCPTNSLSPILDNCMRIQNMYIIPSDSKYSIKEAVYKYGSVYYEFLWNDSYLNLTNYNYNGTIGINGHAVSIIGWDDNFSRYNFKCIPENDGAWIAKNSWGSNETNDGYIYISYENNKNTLSSTTFFTFILNDTNDYDYNYQYDIYCEDIEGDSNSIYISNNFTSDCYGFLAAVSTYFLTENINYTITIKINNNIVHSQSGFMKNKGYYTIPLTNQSLILYENDTFEVIFYLYSNEGVIHLPRCYDSGITHILHPCNSSKSSDDFINWTTFDDGVFCIKAFTITRYNLIAEDVTKFYKGDERFYATLIDRLNQSVENKTIMIELNGRTYTRTTDANGTVSMALGLNSGIYNVNVTFENKTVVSLVTILPTVNGTDVVKMFRNGTQYYATFRDSEGNYLAEGTTVKFNINGVMYERNVFGDKGLARLNINLKQGEYIITAINPDNGEMASNIITVLPLLTENRDITKYYRNGTQYTVKVLNDIGNAVGAGVTVRFNINGVFYERTTNESGIAKLNINLQPGDYIITAEYNGCVVSNNIKVLPVLTAHDITMRYRDGTKFVATLVDGQGKPYAGQTIQFNINGVFYNRITDSSGQAKLNINLMAGEYIITSSYNGCNIANKITITA